LVGVKYFSTIATMQHCFQREIKGRLNSGNNYHPVQNLALSSHLLFKNVNIKTQKV
jgi:hypothetical protein